MVTAKNLIKNSKADLSWDTRDADYTSWRNAVKDYCAQQNIRSWSGTSDAERAALIAAAPNLTVFRPTIRARLASGSEFHKTALQALLHDCLKKKSETAKDLAVKRALKRLRTGGDRGDRDDDDGESVDEGSPVAVWLADRTDAIHRDAASEWIWDVRNRRKLGIIQSRTLDGIWDMVKGYMPAGRTVREILAVLEDPVAPVN